MDATHNGAKWQALVCTLIDLVINHYNVFFELKKKFGWSLWLIIWLFLASKTSCL
jgi:hypothetical protein